MDPLEVELLPILTDNYVFVFKNKVTRSACVVDPGDADACLDYLKKQNLKLENILITHHHGDHIDGIKALCDIFPEAQVYAPYQNQGQIPHVRHWVKEGAQIDLKGLAAFQVIELPGHTLGHVAYHQAQKNWLFSGDVLFGLGCGRLFEGTPKDAFLSLQKIKSFPIETLVFCTHEYTAANLKFTEDLIETKQIPQGFQYKTFMGFKTRFLQKRAEGRPSVPLLLGDEMGWNAFLLCKTVEEFARLREARDQFKLK